MLSKNRVLSLVAFTLIVSSLGARVSAASDLACLYHRRAALEEVEQRQRLAELRKVALDERIRELESHLPAAKKVAGVATAFGAVGIGAGIWAATSAGGAILFGATAGSSVVSPKVMLLPAAASVAGITGLVFSASKLTAIGDAEEAEFAAYLESLGERYTFVDKSGKNHTGILISAEKVAAIGARSSLSEFYALAFDEIHTGISYASIDAQENVGDHWYKIGWDDVTVLNLQIQEAKAHLAWYGIEASFNQSVEKKLLEACGG